MKTKPQALCILAALLLLSCTETITAIKPGDLLFVGIPADYCPGDSTMAAAISKSTGTGDLNFIHAAILDVDSIGVWVLDATIKHGIDRHPLQVFLSDFTLQDGSLPVLEVYRMKDQKHIQLYVETAKGFIGEEYDVYFLPENGKHYCTELIYDSYINDSGHVFTAAPMNFKDPEGQFPEYWVYLFGAIGTQIPQGIPGTNPQAMRTEIRGSNKFQQINYEISNR